MCVGTNDPRGGVDKTLLLKNVDTKENFDTNEKLYPQRKLYSR